MKSPHNSEAVKSALIVDDEASTLKTMVEMLQLAGFATVPITNGREALRCLDARQIDLAIVDLFMPDMDGIETIIRLRKKQNTLPIIAISGGALMSRLDCLRMAQAAGAIATLAKPFTYVELITAIKGVLPDSALVRQLKPVFPSTL